MKKNPYTGSKHHIFGNAQIRCQEYYGVTPDIIDLTQQVRLGRATYIGPSAHQPHARSLYWTNIDRKANGGEGLFAPTVCENGTYNIVTIQKWPKPVLPQEAMHVAAHVYGIGTDFSEIAIRQIHAKKAEFVGPESPDQPRHELRQHWRVKVERQALPVVYDRNPGEIVKILDEPVAEVSRTERDHAAFAAQFAEKFGEMPDVQGMIAQIKTGKALYLGASKRDPSRVKLHWVESGTVSAAVGLNLETDTLVEALSKSEVQRAGRLLPVQGRRSSQVQSRDRHFRRQRS